MTHLREVTLETPVKPVVARFIGNREAEDRTLLPGVTAGEILRDLGLDDSYELSTSDSRRTFRFDDVVFPHVEGGDELWVSPRMEAGS